MRPIKFTALTILVLGSLSLVPVSRGSVATTQADNAATLQHLGERVVAAVQSKRTDSLNGYLLVICKAPLWKDLDKDSDLGPFLRFKAGAKNLDAVVVMPSNPKDGSTYCVYLEGDKPIGFVEVKTAQAEQISDKNVAKGYVALDGGTFETKGQVRFEQGIVHSDDDKPIPTLVIKSDGKQ